MCSSFCANKPCKFSMPCRERLAQPLKRGHLQTLRSASLSCLSRLSSCCTASRSVEIRTKSSLISLLNILFMSRLVRVAKYEGGASLQQTSLLYATTLFSLLLTCPSKTNDENYPIIPRIVTEPLTNGPLQGQ